MFLDDILIFSSNWQEHLELVKLVLQALREHQLYCKLSKCLFGACSRNSLPWARRFRSHHSPGSGKTESGPWLACIPESVSQVRKFLGFANYFRPFLSGIANIAKPLDEITGKNARFQWNNERQVAFESLKSALLTAPVLQLADVFNPFWYIPTLATSLSEQYSYKKLTRSGYPWPTPVGNWHPLKWTTRSPKRKPWLWFLLSEIGSCICSNTSMFSRENQAVEGITLGRVAGRFSLFNAPHPRKGQPCRCLK